MAEPLVSIVIVAYNHAHYLEECLDSILCQTYKNWELIVADDASKDNSVEVINQWLEKNDVKAIKNFHTKNTGLATTLNECIELINGKYVKLLAADDFLHPTNFEKCVNKLEELGNAYGMLFSHTHTIDNSSNIVNDIADYDKLGLVDPIQFRKDLKKSNKIAALTVLMKREALIKTGKYRSDFIIEDYYRWLKINQLYFIGYVPEKLAYYRLHENNISKTKKVRIDSEDLFLKIKFDENGSNATKINNVILNKYYYKNLDSLYLDEYYKYKYRDKILTFCIKFNLPFIFYRVLNKIRK